MTASDPDTLADLELAPPSLFPEGSVGEQLQRGALDGCTLAVAGDGLLLHRARIHRAKDAEPASGERRWHLALEYGCEPPADSNPPGRVWLEPFEPSWLLPFDSCANVQERFRVLLPGAEPLSIRPAFAASLRPPIRPGTLPAWLKSDFVASSQARMHAWAAVEGPGFRASLYCDGIDPTSDIQIGHGVAATMRLEMQRAVEAPVTTSQELYLGSLYPEAFLAPPPSDAVLDDFFSDLYWRHTKKLAELARRIRKSPPLEQWMPHELLHRPSPLALLQKQMKIGSVLLRKK